MQRPGHSRQRGDRALCHEVNDVLVGYHQAVSRPYWINVQERTGRGISIEESRGRAATGDVAKDAVGFGHNFTIPHHDPLRVTAIPITICGRSSREALECL